MTPLQYHGVGLIVLGLWFLHTYYGPSDMQTVPDDSTGFRTFRAGFSFIAWPVTLGWYVLLYGIRGAIGAARLVNWDKAWIVFCWSGYTALLASFLYWLLWCAIPFLVSWYAH